MIKATKKPWVVGQPNFEDPYVDVPKLELEAKIKEQVDKFESEFASIGVIQKINESILVEYADEVEEESQNLKLDLVSSVESTAVDIADALKLDSADSEKVRNIIYDQFKRLVGSTDFKYPVQLD